MVVRILPFKRVAFRGQRRNVRRVHESTHSMRCSVPARGRLLCVVFAGGGEPALSAMVVVVGGPEGAEDANHCQPRLWDT